MRSTVFTVSSVKMQTVIPAILFLEKCITLHQGFRKFSLGFRQPLQCFAFGILDPLVFVQHLLPLSLEETIGYIPSLVGITTYLTSTMDIESSQKTSSLIRIHQVALLPLSPSTTTTELNINDSLLQSQRTDPPILLALHLLTGRLQR
jgi:hypothetical protein